MFHCNSSVVTTARLDTATTLLEGSVAPGILTAKTLQNVLLSAQHRSRNDEIKPTEEIVSPYGRMQRQDRVRRYRNRLNDSDHLHSSRQPTRDVVARRKHCRKLDPMPPLMLRSQMSTDKNISNQISGGNSELEIPDKLHIEQLRSGLNQKIFKQQQDAERLQREIQWIHGHFPVLKLANAKCSRTLRQQLFRTALFHVLTNFTLRKALLTWYQKLLDAQRKERLQLSASRQLIAMFRKLSLERTADRFNTWRQRVVDCQEQENLAAAITLQRFSKFLQSRREEKEAAEQQAILLQALDKMQRSAKTIQRAYRKYRQHLQHCRDEFAARQIQRIVVRRRDYSDFIKRRNAATILQRSYRAYLKRRSRTRARAIAQLLDHSREQKARCIQTAWRGYQEWRDNVLVGIVHKLVDQVEILDAVLSIQRHLRGFQGRFRIKKKTDSAIRIQKCWRAGRRREASRAERQMMLMAQNLAASCLQRTFRRHKVERKVRGVLRKSTRPLYLRAQHLSESFREQFRLPIAKSATVVIQTTWRRHFAYEKEKQRRIAASETIRGFLKHGVVTSKWRITAVNLRHCREAAACTLQRWIRRLNQLRSSSTCQRPYVVSILEQISAATTIQLWYRRRRCDSWRFLLNQLTKELPRCIEAVNRIARCWKAYRVRKQDNLVRESALADLIERQRQSESENSAARIIQRMIKRRIDKHNGQVLLHKYRILLRQDLKRRQQRVIVHKYLEEKSQLRKKKQESQAATLAVRQPISINSMESSQFFGLDSYTSEVSAFALDETPNNNEVLTADSPVQYWSDEYQRAYLYDPVTGVSTWL